MMITLAKMGKHIEKKSDPSDLSNRTNLQYHGSNGLWYKWSTDTEQMVFQFSLPHCIGFKISFELQNIFTKIAILCLAGLWKHLWSLYEHHLTVSNSSKFWGLVIHSILFIGLYNTHKEKSNSVQEFIEVKYWLVLIFPICLCIQLKFHNSNYNEFRARMLKQTDKSSWEKMNGC